MPASVDVEGFEAVGVGEVMGSGLVKRPVVGS
jgi:hypothetical protein